MRSTRPLHPVELISARIDCEITPGEERYLDAHLLECPTCTKRASVLQSVNAVLATLPVAEPPAAGLKKLLNRLRDTKGEKPAITVVPPEITWNARAPRRMKWRLFALATCTLAGLVTLYRPSDAGNVPAVVRAAEDGPRAVSDKVARNGSAAETTPPAHTTQPVTSDAGLGVCMSEDATFPQSM